MSKKICVSFDYEKDRRYYYMLQAWDKNASFDFTFEDCTPSEIQSNDIGRIKAVLTNKIREASHVLVIVGEDANRLHKDSQEIGYRNWQNYEIATAKKLTKKLVAVKIKNENNPPAELFGAGAAWARSFTEESIKRAINNA